MKIKVLAALLGGAIAGFLAGLPVVGWLWFIWAIAGGSLAVYFYYRKTGPKIEVIDGLIVGGLAGLTAAIVNLIEVLVFAAIGALITSLTQTGASDDRLAAFGIAFMLGMINVVFNIFWSILMLALSLLSGLAVALILNSSNKNSQPPAYGGPSN